MTERLAQLLHAEADRLDVPTPDAATALSLGRGRRRRRRLATGAASIAVLAVIGGSALGALGVNAITGDDGGSKVEPAAPYDSGAVFSIGTTVYLDNAAVQAPIDDKAIKSLHYTSVGVLVRHGDNNWSDGGGPQRFSMVRPDGSVDLLDITLEETVHSTDPTQPYMAYAVKAGDGADLVIRDLRDDTEVARVPLPSSDPGGGWSVPAVALSGDLVYVSTAPTPYVVNWRTGEATETDVIESGIVPGVKGGRETAGDRNEIRVVDIETGQSLLSAALEKNQYGYFNLSPDGRYAILSIDDMMSGGSGAAPVEVYDVDTGKYVSLPAGDYGWTGQADLFEVTKEELTTCDATTGECTIVDHGIEMPPKGSPEEICETYNGREECYTQPGETWEGSLRLGGRMYES